MDSLLCFVKYRGPLLRTLTGARQNRETFLRYQAHFKARPSLKALPTLSPRRK
jgi:hypothetical protein